MKLMIRAVASLALVAGGVGAAHAAAGDCSNALSIPQTGGDTCTGGTYAAQLCGAFSYTAGSTPPQLVYAFTLAAGHTATQITISNLSQTYTSPFLVITSSACADAGVCPAANAGTSVSLTGVANGSYFLFVTGPFNQAATDCGTFNIAADGTLPVKLQSFSID